MNKFFSLILSILILVALFSCSPDNPEPFEWDITARVGKPIAGDTVDHGNWKAVVSISYENNILSITANENELESFVLEDVSDDENPHKWFSILIGTGESDITKLMLNGEPLTSSARDNFTGDDGSEVADDEFILWINTDNANTSVLELTHENSNSINIKIEYSPSPLETMSSEEKASIKEFIFSFGHDKVIQDLNTLISGSNISCISNFTISETDSSLSTMITYENYDYDGTHGNKTVSGTICCDFIGNIDNNNYFQASEYRIYIPDENQLILDEASEPISISIPESNPISGKFASKATDDGIPLNITFKMENDKPIAIDDEDFQVVKFQAPSQGDIGIVGKAAEPVVDIIGDISDFEGSVSGADLSDLLPMLEYVSDIAHWRNFSNLWWNGLGTDPLSNGFSSEAAVYDNEAKTLTFNITLNNYGYNGKTTDPSSIDKISGSMQLIFIGNEDGQNNFIADRWQVISDELLLTDGSGADSITSKDVNLSGPIVTGSTVGGTPTTISFRIDASGSGWDRTSEFGSDFSQYNDKYFKNKYIGLDNLYGKCETEDNKLSGEIFNYLIEKYF